MRLFAVGNVLTTTTTSLPLLLDRRLLAGLMHGVVLAIAIIGALSAAALTVFTPVIRLPSMMAGAPKPSVWSA